MDLSRKDRYEGIFAHGELHSRHDFRFCAREKDYARSSVIFNGFKSSQLHTKNFLPEVTAAPLKGWEAEARAAI